jgi:L-rhamnose isomerase
LPVKVVVPAAKAEVSRDIEELRDARIDRVLAWILGTIRSAAAGLIIEHHSPIFQLAQWKEIVGWHLRPTVQHEQRLSFHIKEKFRSVHSVPE